MIEALFISDLHLNPQDESISKRFEAFVSWAAKRAKKLYILGDFFHAWPGDEAMDAWSDSIAKRLLWLHQQGMEIYYLAGNRDFLLGSQFLRKAKMQLLQEPALIELGEERVLLRHGDSYCTNDYGHQLLRKLTRNRLFPKIFLSLPYKFRCKIVRQVRKQSQLKHAKQKRHYDVVKKSMLKDMQKQQSKLVIHGHIHKPQHNCFLHQGDLYQQYVLSDWDDKAHVLCYDKSSGFYFELFSG